MSLHGKQIKINSDFLDTLGTKVGGNRPRMIDMPERARSYRRMACWMDGRMDGLYPKESTPESHSGKPENGERGSRPPGVERRGPRAAAEMPPVSGDRPLTRNGKAVRGTWPLAGDWEREVGANSAPWRNKKRKLKMKGCHCM